MSISITSTTVISQSGAVTIVKVAGETIVQGAPVYKDSVSGKYFKAVSDTAAHANVQGVSLTASSNNQPIVVCTSGDVAYGAATFLNVGGLVMASSTAGHVADWTEVTANNYTTFLGYAKTDSILGLDIKASGQQCTSGPGD